MAKTFRKGGIHPPEYKFTSADPIVDLPLPTKVVLTLSQHIGAPALPTVKLGDKVKRGDMVGKAEAFMSVPVHTPISGTVKSVELNHDGSGRVVHTITILADEADAQADKEAPRPERATAEQLAALSPDDIKRIARESGLVGLGGATFPMHVKLSPPADVIIDTLLINGAECEPFLTCDNALMLQSPAEIIEGARYAARALCAPSIIIGIENNKPQAIKAMTAAASGIDGVEVVPLKVKYPQGGEKQLINALTGRVVPTGALPSAVGCAVMNVASAYSLTRAVAYGEPLMERVMTLSGINLAGAGNYRVAVGTPLSDILTLLPPEAVETAGKVLAGGPMMGKALDNLDAPIRKGTSGIVILPKAMAERSPVEPCVRCARCVDACPMGLAPYLLSNLSRLARYQEASDEGVLNCVECGSCQYVCPSSRPLLDYIRLGKNNARMLLKKK